MTKTQIESRLSALESAQAGPIPFAVEIEPGADVQAAVAAYRRRHGQAPLMILHIPKRRGYEPGGPS